MRHFTLLNKRGIMNKRAMCRSDEERYQIIRAARISSLSDFEYCKNNSIASGSFYCEL